MSLLHQMRMKNGIPLTLTLSREGAREKRTKEFIVPSPLMGEGEDEGESPRIRHAMACRYIRWRSGAIKNCTLHLIIFCRGLIHNARGFTE